MPHKSAHNPRSGHLEIVATSEAGERSDANLLVFPYSGSLSAAASRVDQALAGELARLASGAEVGREPGSIAVLQVPEASGLAPRRVGLVGVGEPDRVDDDAVRTAAGAAAQALHRLGGTLAWAFDPDLALDADRQVRAVVEGAVLGAHDPARWKTGGRPARLDRLLIAEAPEGLEVSAAQAAIVARWTNHARELVDGPPNEITPEGLGRATTELLAGTQVRVEVHALGDPAAAGLRALTLVGNGSVNAPCLIVLRYHAGAGDGPVLGLVGKAVTFDSGGYFLKPQGDLVKMKADMGGGAAVIGALGAIAELELPLSVLAVIPAAENMIGGGAFRPGDIFTTASGLTVEVTNPDAEGRLILADAIWYARQEGATHLVDVATLTGAMRGGMGDMYTGVFANRDEWRAQLVAAGEASGDHAWPWPLHRRYRRLVESRLADLRNTAGRSFGYPIVAAAFLESFVGDTPWAHLDIQSTAYLDEPRDYLAAGATGAGVRLLTELARTMARPGASS